eukprot:14705729-Alexandrium_andersonii.AAC.1
MRVPGATVREHRQPDAELIHDRRPYWLQRFLTARGRLPGGAIPCFPCSMEWRPPGAGAGKGARPTT